MKLLKIGALALAASFVTTAATAGDWTGAYGGVHLGYAETSVWAPTNTASGGVYGVHLGYDYDFGDWVLGGRLDYDGTNITLGGTKFDSIGRLGLRAGYDMDRGLVYGIGGAVRATTSNAGSDTGWFAGIGYEHMLADNISLNSEVLYHRFDNYNGLGVNVDAAVINVGVSYRF